MLPRHFLIEGLDRLGKDTLVDGILHRLGYHQVIHYQKPKRLKCYENHSAPENEALMSYQRASFQTMFQLLAGVPLTRMIFNRAHLGECVYSPIYRDYPGDYVFDLERDYKAREMSHVRLVLLVEDFACSRHFVDDGQSLGGHEKRREEQRLFREAFDRSGLVDKRLVCVTDSVTGQFRTAATILNEVLA